MDYSLPVSSIHGIFWAKILEWVAISFSSRPSQSRDRTLVSHVAGRLLTVWATEVTLLVVWKLIVLHLTIDGFLCTIRTSQVALVVKNPPANAGDIIDMGSIPGSGRSPGGGHSNPFQYSYLEDPKNRGAWRLRFIGLQRVERDWSNLARPHAYLIRHHGLLYTSWTMSFELCPGVILFWISFWTPGLHFP